MKAKSNFKYVVSGPNGRNEGPFDLEGIKQLIAAGKITGETFVQRSDSEHWSTAADFAELGVKDVVVSAYDNEGRADALTQEIEESHFKRAVRTGAGWFFWIVAMSLFNCIAAFFGSQAGFALGLSIVYPIGDFGATFGPKGSLLALVAGLALSGLYLFFGVASWKKHFTPYLLGMSLYAGDAVLAFVAGDWISAGIHVVALFFMYQGLDAHMTRKASGWNVGLLLRSAACAIIIAGGGLGLTAMAAPKADIAHLHRGPANVTTNSHSSL